MIAVWTSSGSLPLPCAGGRDRGRPVPGLLGNHHDGTSPLSLTPEGPVTADWPMTSMLPQTGHLVRFPAWWSSALNLLPQEHDTEIIATTLERNRQIPRSGSASGHETRRIDRLPSFPTPGDYNRGKGRCVMPLARKSRSESPHPPLSRRRRGGHDGAGDDPAGRWRDDPGPPSPDRGPRSEALLRGPGKMLEWAADRPPHRSSAVSPRGPSQDAPWSIPRRRDSGRRRSRAA